ncbi:MAG: SWIM zinc finger family protein, partial [Blastocatellia bacterium]|nr:SWIM zinc finger family protein [Blastocatellia bacterium]
IFTPSLWIDKDERITRAECSCNWHKQNKLYKGPCEHILALRMQHNR